VWWATGTYPQSASWVKAIPWYQYMAKGKEIEAGLEAATAPMVRRDVPDTTFTYGSPDAFCTVRSSESSYEKRSAQLLTMVFRLKNLPLK
jgi:hypothetical protein